MGSAKISQKGLTSRQRTKLRIRKNLSGSAARPRLTVFKSSKHMYAQVVIDTNGTTLASASTREKEVQEVVSQVVAEAAKKEDTKKEGAKKEGTKQEGANTIASTKSRNAALAVGIVLAKRSLEKQIEGVVFDRNGYIYAGRVQALADGARKGGLKF